jgi:hypothetical protein
MTESTETVLDLHLRTAGSHPRPLTPALQRMDLTRAPSQAGDTQMSLGVSSGLAFCAILLGMLGVSGCDAAIACTVPRCMFHVIVRCMLDATLHVACYCALHVGCHVHVAWRMVQYIRVPVAYCIPHAMS